MGIKGSSQAQSILSILLLTTVFLLFRYTVNPSTPPPVADKMPDSVDVISKLKVSVRQVSARPAKLGVSVTNAHDGPVTILSWNSPLDPLALQLGVVSFVPAGSESDGSPIQIPTIQIRRRMPPGPESLVTIGAGQTREQELELKEPIVPLEKLRGRRVAVVCRGEWISVWPSEADAITKVSLENAGASDDAFRGDFQSEAVEIEL
ncbi:hypothetical protein F4781DRAFT_20002 [Annulohypoxylon bovei var. microspora]|nr:hypothetical protein F4781DRAFT_20002 [Annulohypoxylon bovei var. microspora]